MMHQDAFKSERFNIPILYISKIIQKYFEYNLNSELDFAPNIPLVYLKEIAQKLRL
jgi:hypothetical protein